jgi:hypothetical protein
MRWDMDKVIVERPRRGSCQRHDAKGHRKRRDRGPLDEAPCRESTAPNRRHGYDGKEQTDLLGPLRRFLEKRLGRRWDDVFAEVCARTSARNAVQSHLRDHVLRMVEFNVVFQDGRPAYRTRSHNPYLSRQGFLLFPGCLYVHPETGILCRVPHPPRDRKSDPPDFVPCPGNNLKQYHRVNGVWHEVTLARYWGWHDLFEEIKVQVHWYPVAEFRTEWAIRDRLFHLREAHLRTSRGRAYRVPSRVANTLSRWYGRPGVYAAAARPLSRNEIHQLKLDRSEGE